MRVPFPVLLLLTALLAGLGAWVGIITTRDIGRVASIWPPNAIVLAIMLGRAKGMWPALLVAAFVGNASANLFAGDSLLLATALSLCNSAEVALAAYLLDRWIGGRALDLTRPRDLLGFAAICALAAPGLSAFLGAGSLWLIAGAGFWGTVTVWFPADALGLAIITPLLLALRGADWKDILQPRRLGLLVLVIALIVGVSFAVFGQTRYPLLFFLLPPVLVAVALFSFVGAAIGIATVTVIAITLTVQGLGPLALIAQGDLAERVLILQLLLFILSSTSLHAAATLANRDRLSQKLRESEADFRLLAEHAADLVARLDSQGVFRYVSPSAERVLGHAADTLLGRRLAEILHPDDHSRDAAQAALPFSLAIEGSGEPLAVRVVAADGRTIWIEATIRTLSDAATGAPTGYVAVARDVTERHRMEEERAEREAALGVANERFDRLARHLGRARDRAEAATRSKSRFLAAMSHELRTPLHGILGYAQLMRLEAQLDPTQVARLDAMLDAGRHLLEMIEKVLDLSQIEADRVELRPTEVDLEALCRSCLDLVRSLADAKGLGLALEVAPHAVTRATADAARLRQVILNLLGNAVKFTPEGGVTLRLRPGAPGCLRLEVADTGRGVPEHQRAQLFADFSRLDAAQGPTTATEGAGLGLAITARLVALMGGRIGHADNAGGGSVFWLELPLAEAAAPQVADAPPAAPAKPAAGAALRILVVDDIEVNRKIAEGFLVSLGHRVTSVASGEDALDAVQGGGSDIVLMDVRMPGIGGLEATRRIRALAGPEAEVTILALTAGAMAEQQAEAREAGMDGFVTKPFSRASLLEAIAAAPPSHPRSAAGPATSAPSPEPASTAPAVFDEAAFRDLIALVPAEDVAPLLDGLLERAHKLSAELEAMRASRNQVDPRALVPAVHALGGAVGNFGFRRFAMEARAFEEAALRDAALARARVTGLEEALTSTLDVLRARAASTADS